jgi:hypothetical protein
MTRLKARATPVMPPLDRRRFLALSGQGLGYSALITLLPGCGGSGGSAAPGAPPPVVDGLPPASAEVQALRRTSFGVSPDSLDAINALGVADYLEQQLNYLAIDDSALEAAVAASFPLAEPAAVGALSGFPRECPGDRPRFARGHGLSRILQPAPALRGHGGVLE